MTKEFYLQKSADNFLKAFDIEREFFNTFSRIFNDNFKDKFPFYDIYIEVDDKDRKYCVFEVALAGYKKDDLTVYIENSQLIIESNEKEKEETDYPKRKYIKHNITSKPFKLYFILGNQLDEENPEVTFENGILKIVFEINNKNRKLIWGK